MFSQTLRGRSILCSWSCNFNVLNYLWQIEEEWFRFWLVSSWLQWLLESHPVKQVFWCSLPLLQCRTLLMCHVLKYCNAHCWTNSIFAFPLYLSKGQLSRFQRLAKHQANGNMCECDYYPGGCMIIDPPPEGYKCVCNYDFLWTCSGYANQCDESEDCPANCKTHACCKRGGGECSAYGRNWCEMTLQSWNE